jgi:hypothetical protein
MIALSQRIHGRRAGLLEIVGLVHSWQIRALTFPYRGLGPIRGVVPQAPTKECRAEEFESTSSPTKLDSVMDTPTITELTRSAGYVVRSVEGAPAVDIQGGVFVGATLNIVP